MLKLADGISGTQERQKTEMLPKVAGLREIWQDVLHMRRSEASFNVYVKCVLQGLLEMYGGKQQEEFQGNRSSASQSRAVGMRLCPFSGWILFSGNTAEAEVGKGWNIMQGINWEAKQGYGPKLHMATQRNRSKVNEA